MKTEKSKISRKSYLNISNFGRGAGNRTQPVCSQSIYTTDILHPVVVGIIPQVHFFESYFARGSAI
jgi:hypothetical protein